MSELSVKLNTGHSMPLCCYGTWQITGTEVRAAIEAGYRHIDCAWMYQNEEEIGNTLQKLYKDGIVKRSDLFITSKLWCTHNKPKNVREGFMDSLTKMQTDYLDLYLIHTPTSLDKGNGKEVFPKGRNGQLHLDNSTYYLDTWKELEKLQKEGLVRSIGVSNFNEYQINKILDAGLVTPAVHQTECHPYLTETMHIDYCESKGIVVLGFAVLGSPKRPWALEGDPVVLEDKTLNEIAEKHGKTPAQIAIRFLVQQGVGAIAKSANKDRIRSNFEVSGFELTTEDMVAINALNKDWRGFSFAMFFKDHRHWPHRPKYSEKTQRVGLACCLP